MAAVGNAISVWQRNAGPDEVIQAAAYDGAGPELRGLSIRGAGQVGEQLSFSVSPFAALPEGRSLPGVAKLGLRVKQKRKRKVVTIARKRISVPAGKRRNLRIKLNRRGKKALRQAAKRNRPLKATLSGTGVKARKVVLR